MNILLCGALGRMGQAVTRRCEALGFNITAGVDAAYTGQAAGYPIYRECHEVQEPADVMIDFTKPEAIKDLLPFALARHMPLVLAVTGYGESAMRAIREASSKLPIFQSANMSLGISLLKTLITQAASILGSDFDVEIVETHHNQKADAPSGTALMLYRGLQEAYGQPMEMMPGRSGANCKRRPNEIGVHALRGGTVPGTHEVGFYGPDEILTLTHTAQSRDIFAAGAVRAAQFIVNKKPGLYCMDDLVK